MIRVHSDKIKDLPIGTVVLVEKSLNSKMLNSEKPIFQIWCKKSKNGLDYLYPNVIKEKKVFSDDCSDLEGATYYVPSKESKYFSDYDTEVSPKDSVALLSFLSDAFVAVKSKEECNQLYKIITELTTIVYQNRIETFKD